MVWSLVHSTVLTPLGQALKAVSSQEADPAEVWYLSPEQHVAELIFFNTVFIGGLFYLRGWESKTNASSKNIQEEQQLTPILKIYRFILTACLLVTACHKYLGNKLSYLLMPCHCATACYLYCLYSKNKRNAEITFNVSVHFLFYTFLAILMPDFRSLTLPGEIINFWLHHWILLVIPIHLICTNYYNLEASKRVYYYLLAACWGGLVHFDIMGIAGLLSGLNVGYMLHPPRHTPFKGVWFRWGHAAFLILMGAFCGFILVPLIHKITNFIHSRWVNNKKVDVHQTNGKQILDGEYMIDGDKKIKSKQN